MKLPKLFIFDMDGLMFDTERLFMNFLIETAARYQYTITPELYYSTIGCNGDFLKKQMLSALGSDYPFEEISRKTMDKIKTYALKNGLPEKEGLKSLLNYLDNKQIPCCVASSSDSLLVNTYLEKNQLQSYFSFVIGGDQVTKSKPAPEIFLKACEHFHIAPEHACVLEDSENGILASVSAGIPVICIPDLKLPEYEILNKTLFTTSSLKKVLTILSL